LLEEERKLELYSGLTRVGDVILERIFLVQGPFGRMNSALKLTVFNPPVPNPSPVRSNGFLPTPVAPVARGGEYEREDVALTANLF
jgi:hypothetical protein